MRHGTSSQVGIFVEQQRISFATEMCLSSLGLLSTGFLCGMAQAVKWASLSNSKELALQLKCVYLPWVCLVLVSYVQYTTSVEHVCMPYMIWLA
jgi:hypothetical protein